MKDKAKHLNSGQTAPKSSGHDASTQGVRTIRVWDFPTRVFHWAMAGVVLIAWVSSEGGSAFAIHVYSGTLLIGFVAFRAIWGVIGSRHAQFGDFVQGPEAVMEYSKRLMAFQPPHMVGHNPLGGWMVIGLLVVILMAVLTGMMSSKGGYVGPLAHIGGGIFGEAHEAFANLLLMLIFGHVAGVYIHGFISRENLPRAMITGNKELPNGSTAESIRPVGIVRPMIAVAFALAVVWYFMR